MSIRRKIQLTGTSTYVVSLPKAWAEKNGVKAGKEILIREQQDGTLCLGLEDIPQKERHLSINSQNVSTPQELRRLLLAGYLSGCDSMRFYSDSGISDDAKAAFEGEVKRLAGFRITDEAKNELLIQDFFSPSSLSIEKTAKRAYTFSCRMLGELGAAFSGGLSRERLSRMLEMEDEVDSLYFLVIRQAKAAISDSGRLQALGMTASDCVDFMLLVRHIEKMADLSYFAAERLAGGKGNAPGKGSHLALLGKTHSDALLAYSDASGAFFSRDLQKANATLSRISEKTKCSSSLASKLSDSKSGQEGCSEYASLMRAMEISSGIAQLAMSRALGSKGTPEISGF